MNAWSGFVCPSCETQMPCGTVARYRCDNCGNETLDVAMDLSAATSLGVHVLRKRQDPSMWRYRELLPVDVPAVSTGPLRDTGFTPLYPAPRIAERLGLARVWLKDDGRLPSGSFKDRASAVVVMRAEALGEEAIITASTGNAGVALALMARAANQRAIVLVPRSAPRAKIAQLLVYGAELYAVDGNYDAAFALSRTASQELGLYCRNTGYNPFTVEGKKTSSFEICEQLAAALGEAGMRAPDRIYVSVGDGNIITGVHKGLRELLGLGWIDRMPKLIGVQAEGSAAIANAFIAGTSTIESVASHSVADSICADTPADGQRALRAVRDTAGSYVVVSDQAILSALVGLARDGCVFAEPAAAAAYAGLLQQAAAGDVQPDEQVVVLVTGNGLKDVAAAERASAEPTVIEPTLTALSRAMASRSKEAS